VWTKSTLHAHPRVLTKAVALTSMSAKVSGLEVHSRVQVQFGELGGPRLDVQEDFRGSKADV
jgi:hypothetical protein